MAGQSNSFNREKFSCGVEAYRFSYRPVIYAVLFACALFLAFHNWNYTTAIDGSASIIKNSDFRESRRDVAYFFILIFAIILLLQRAKNRLVVRGATGWLILLFFGLAFLSPIWADDAALTFRKLIIFAILSLAALAISRRLTSQDIVLFTFVLSGLSIAVAIVAEIETGAFVPLSEDYRFMGTLGPNRTGLNAAILVLSSIALARMVPRRRRLLLSVALLACAILILTRSRTAFGALLFASAIFFTITGSFRRRLISVLVTGTCCAVFILIAGETMLSVSREAVLLGRSVEDVGSLTGRIPLWSACLDYSNERPLLGYGYNSFWTLERAEDISHAISWQTGGAHSAYLEVLLDLGFTGLGIYLAVVIAFLVRSSTQWRKSRNLSFAFFSALIFLFLLNGLLESLVISYPEALNFVALLPVFYVGFVRSSSDLNFHDQRSFPTGRN